MEPLTPKANNKKNRTSEPITFEDLEKKLKIMQQFEVQSNLSEKPLIPREVLIDQLNIRKCASSEIHANQRNKAQKVAVKKETQTKNLTQKKTVYSIENFLDSFPSMFVIGIATIFVLFGNDIKKMMLSPSYDNLINSIYLSFLILFALEIILTCIAKPDYMSSFFFILDVIATVSLILEIDWIFDSLISSIVENDSQETGSNAKNIIKKATNASRLTRVLRVIRLIRLMRIVKLYKAALQTKRNVNNLIKKRKNQKNKNENLNKEKNVELDSLEEMQKESQISKTVSILITQNLIAIIMVMSIFMPIMSEDLYFAYDTNSYNILTAYICNFRTEGEGGNPMNSLPQLDYFLTEYEPKEPIINITLGESLFYFNETMKSTDFRAEQVGYAYHLNGECSVSYSLEESYFYDSLCGFLNTLITCIILIIASIFFENDARTLVLDPLEVMIEIVENVAKDPMSAFKRNELENGVKALIFKLQTGGLSKNEKAGEKYEVLLIKQAILNISSLLAIGFGEAGCMIIKQNLKNKVFNAIGEGKKINGVFCFIEIRRFNEIIRDSKEKSILLVNEIASILHRSIDKYYGYPNRNLGDVFVNIWKADSGEGPKNLTPESASNFAILAYLDAIYELNRSSRISAFEAENWENDRLKLSLGFGIHYGFAIEGAIGSDHKIDASYLSMNVNIAARLEAATKQYGVNLLISGQVYEKLTSKMQVKCRLVDVVKVKGSDQPIKLYTMDTNTTIERRTRRASTFIEMKNNHQNEKEMIELKVQELGNTVFENLMNTSEINNVLSVNRTKKFYATFKQAISSYLEGNWEESKGLLQYCVKTFEDGPSKTILKFMESQYYTSPSDWKGYRELTSK